MSAEYQKFLDRKRMTAPVVGFDPRALHSRAYPHQRDIARWACKRGRAAIFADCGLMKTGIELMWANEVNGHSNAPVLMLAPLLSDSWEEFYQEVRRQLRFGQQCAVESHVFLSELEMGVYRNLERKRKDSERMAAALVEHMRDFNQREIRGVTRETIEYLPTLPISLPGWVNV